MRGFHAIGIYHPKREVNVGTLWRSATLYNAAFIFTVGRRYTEQAADTTKAHRHIPLLHFADVGDLIRHLPYSCPLVGVELDDRAKRLSDYWHPDRAAYLLGAEDHGLPDQVVDQCHDLVTIPTPRDFSHNVAVAGSILLHDRYAKEM